MKNPNFSLKSLRVKHQYTQQYVAKILEIAETTYNRKENGVTDFTVAEAKKLARLFKVSPMDIFFNN